MGSGQFLGQNSMDEEFEFLQIEEEEEEILGLWEFVDPSDADSSEEEANGSGGPRNAPSSFSSSISISPPRTGTHRRPQIVRLLDVGPNLKPYQDGVDDDVGHGDEGEDDDDDDDDGYGLDDELVPWSVSDKLGRQRMRKMGKRTSNSKMNNSKRLPYLLVRPGCVRGKHGLGLKHIY